MNASTLAQECQMHSRDYYVRLSSHALGDIEFEHLHSAHDAAVLDDALEAHGRHTLWAGSTEWHCQDTAAPLSLAWDWVVQADGEVRLLHVVPPRTNLQVIDPKGYDLPQAQAIPHLVDLIESLPWRTKVLQALAEKSVLTIPNH
jgi:hypothetical protein